MCYLDPAGLKKNRVNEIRWVTRQTDGQTDRQLNQQANIPLGLDKFD